MNPNQVVNHMSTMLPHLFVASGSQESTVVALKQRFCVLQKLRFETGTNASLSHSPLPPCGMGGQQVLGRMLPMLLYLGNLKWRYISTGVRQKQAKCTLLRTEMQQNDPKYNFMFRNAP